ncbi:MAG: (deoxy)nucleoside triphosphate pyrophosphohydrolase [Phycisphaerales bacterium]|nr:(deoxy)nucleoside triphosphate pyrophosphohydrolase [Phycisphaerales bacterium]
MKPTVTHEVAIALVECDGRWLVARRHDHVHLGGMWEFPGGKLHDGETHSEAALRELLEECGVTAVANAVLETIPVEYPDRRVLLTPVLCAWKSGEARPLASAACRWVTDSELDALEMPAINARVMAEARRRRNLP